MPRIRILIFSLILCLLSACSAPKKTSPQNPEISLLTAQDGVYSVSQVAARVSPSVVGIATVSTGLNGAREGIGTGVIVSSDGYILTNHHVAGMATRVDVVMSDGTRARARMLWSDVALDLAVLKVEGRFLAATLASSVEVTVGEPVVAIGTPLTLQFQHTVTSGVVSAVNRTLMLPSDDGTTFLEDLIQHDASINPGNSGGPLLNLRGEVIGINTVKVTEAEGIGFAVPVDIARIILDHFLSDGSFEAPYAGLFVIDANMARFYDEEVALPDGLLVVAVDPDGPAAKAGIAQGDILVGADGDEPVTLLDFKCAQFAHLPGERLKLTYERSGRRFDASLDLENQP